MFLLTHHALSLIPEHGGRIIDGASLAGRNGGHPGALAYATAKAAVLGFTRSLAKELAPRGITVNALAPGFIEATPFHDTFTTQESRNATITGIPADRAGIPEDGRVGPVAGHGGLRLRDRDRGGHQRGPVLHLTGETPRPG